jgi:hypothetical protein
MTVPIEPGGLCVGGAPLGFAVFGTLTSFTPPEYVRQELVRVPAR